ncbi:hypothetical protein BN170_850016 [Clostridioides difficile T22]|uniref:Uncharacterized protein n=1 Tax=Clostridioides difficile TaxID=1496 RepID=A0A068ZZP3_CLODI|nr:hypothetical protein BN170_850016 [Clostridioides difficile T22]CCL16949.1 hypothetical protein BN171_1020016 [Clostridioides difficile E25]CCL20893.1 hypothetical protein BN172_1270006 [Clostridioides difficile T15]CCL41523.1 hypothetical protein BN177_320087 [Clostridioides difficile E24]CCL45274.1 hypothetical protein BN178_370023 [Clostridioides difficile T42]CCL52010.1 hypothetical protein BN179_900011 [Clostridioides difficile T6]CCL55761.1 hypothetical protein BN180_760011 [Clostrid
MIFPTFVAMISPTGDIGSDKTNATNVAHAKPGKLGFLTKFFIIIAIITNKNPDTLPINKS